MVSQVSEKTADPPLGPWRLPAAEVLQQQGVSGDRGLSSSEAEARLARCGPNRLMEHKPRSPLLILIAQLRSVLVVLLAVGGGLSLGFGQWVEGGAIFAVILLNALIGFFTELSAVRSMEALRRLGQVVVTVRRDGELGRVAAEALVPGDIVVLDGGDLVAADLRLIEANKLQANESSLTGESVPVAKHVRPLTDDPPLGDRRNMAFKGTSITRGSAEGVVVATGLGSELGKISRLVAEAKDETTPLERRLEELGRNLVWVTLAIAPLVAATGWLAGKPLLLLIETAIALAVAAVPEGLPIIATIALARAMYRLAGRRVLVTRLSAVETLGATSVICTDKTGTLTENRMTVRRFLVAGGEVLIDEEGPGAAPPQGVPALQAALRVSALCNNASYELGRGVGDPLEVALLEAADRAGCPKSKIVADAPELIEHAFDPERKLMATVHAVDGGTWLAIKGAPEAVLAVCSHELVGDATVPLSKERREAWEARCDAAAAHGLRLIGLAQRTVANPQAPPYQDATWLGAAALWDPPRAEVAAAIRACRRAGIEVVMVTGDHPSTARSVAVAVGIFEGAREPAAAPGGEGAAMASGDGAVVRRPEDLGDDARIAGIERVVLGAALDDLGSKSAEACRELATVRVFARVSPRQKLELIGLHQQLRGVVAMTGDGVNDAPALRKADIGVAMGTRGTDVAKQAADMVLEDDSFASVAVAVAAGRTIFDNIRRFVIYLLSCNLSEVLVVTLAAVIGAPLPLMPLQILFLNLVTDVFPALALGVGPASEGVMLRPPRPFDEPIISRRHWQRICVFAAILTTSVLSAFAIALVVHDMSRTEAVTVAFLALALGQLVFVFNMRSTASTLFRNEITRNRWVWLAIAICVALLAAAVYVPVLAKVLGITAPSVLGWQLIAGATLGATLGGQLVVWSAKVRSRAGAPAGARVSNLRGSGGSRGARSARSL